MLNVSLATDPVPDPSVAPVITQERVRESVSQQASEYEGLSMLAGIM